jgi:superfamily II DNA/RNA helicase
MTICVTVNNTPPHGEWDPSLPSRLAALFCAGTQNEAAKPFPHQIQAFHHVLEDKELFLVAGTASGKTLAVGAPLFYKLERGLIRKVLLMYPTIALLEDQKRVMQQLAIATQLEVGQLQGGMSRSKLIENLNKQILVATPDEIYWFFRKNVKYNSLLIYGLCQVDEFVLDEAHLFNGLMLRNFEHLWQRIKTMAGCLDKMPRLHILTATPTTNLLKLNGGEPIHGNSKCYDVDVSFDTSGRYDRDKQIVEKINEALKAKQSKVLVVCNSARMTHQLFERHKVEDATLIPVEHRMRFGRVKLGDLITWLEKAGIEKILIDELNDSLFSEGDVFLDDVPAGTMLRLPLQDFISQTVETLERQCWQVKRALWERGQQPSETWETLLRNRPLPCGIIAAVRKYLAQTVDVEKQQSIVDEWLTDILEKLGNVTDDPIPCKAKDFAALTRAFTSVGIDERLALQLTHRLKHEIKADTKQLPVRRLSQRYIYLRWLDWIIEKDKANRVREAVKIGLESGELEAECRHIGLWKGTNVPVIVYSGSMAKHAREGLIHVFSDLDRAVLISTSAVEVGVDFHAEVLITEECEGISFLQRFGRVGRHGKDSKVIVLISGDTYSKLSELDDARISRTDFSDKMIQIFPTRNYAANSLLLDANHYLVNEQLGRTGVRLNALPGLVEAQMAAAKLRTADIQLNYGLRSTMPQITLSDGVTKDPFYLLRYVDNEYLRPADSPFEVARAKIWFTSLIFQKARFNVIVNLDETLKASRYLFILHGAEPQLFSGRGIANRHIRGLLERVPWNSSQSLYFLLIHGDVYLSRIDREISTPEDVTDSEQNPLFIPNQTYLVMYGWKDADSTRQLLRATKTEDWEELLYDWDRFNLDSNIAMVILEDTTGACFAVYKELVDYVGRQVQK